MLKLILSLRFAALFTSFGAVVGALLMFWVGSLKLIGAFSLLVQGAEGIKPITAAVMGATDAFLFGAVLIIFAYAIAFGFALQASPEYRERLPAWMQVESVGALKRTLIEVILVYLVVDFVTDLAAGEGHVSAETLVLPMAIVLIAVALWLMSGGESKNGAH